MISISSCFAFDFHWGTHDDTLKITFIIEWWWKMLKYKQLWKTWKMWRMNLKSYHHYEVVSLWKKQSSGKTQTNSSLTPLLCTYSLNGKLFVSFIRYYSRIIHHLYLVNTSFIYLNLCIYWWPTVNYFICHLSLNIHYSSAFSRFSEKKTRSFKYYLPAGIC